MSAPPRPVEDGVGDGLSPRTSRLVALLLVIGLAGGVAVLVGDLIGNTLVVLIGLVVCLVCSIAAGCFAFVDSRRRGVSIFRSLWDGVRAIFSALGLLI